MSPINDPDTLAAVRAAFAAYERALLRNDVPTLQQFFWDSPQAVRFGISEELYGFEAIAAFRRDRVLNFTKREPQQLAISTFGDSCASVMFEYKSDIGGNEHLGRQSQTWIKHEGAWKIATAHVSLSTKEEPPFQKTRRALEELGLSPEPEWLERIEANFAVTAKMAAELLAFPLPEYTEPAPVFRP